MPINEYFFCLSRYLASYHQALFIDLKKKLFATFVGIKIKLQLRRYLITKYNISFKFQIIMIVTAFNK